MSLDYCRYPTASMHREAGMENKTSGSDGCSSSYCEVVKPIMDLNDITREFERYQRKLSNERMVDLREMLLSMVLDSDTCESLVISIGSSQNSGISQTAMLPLLSQRTLEAYEKVLEEKSRRNSL